MAVARIPAAGSRHAALPGPTGRPQVSARSACLTTRSCMLHGLCNAHGRRHAKCAPDFPYNNLFLTCSCCAGHQRSSSYAQRQAGTAQWVFDRANSADAGKPTGRPTWPGAHHAAGCLEVVPRISPQLPAHVTALRRRCLSLVATPPGPPQHGSVSALIAARGRWRHRGAATAASHTSAAASSRARASRGGCRLPSVPPGEHQPGVVPGRVHDAGGGCS